MPTPHLLSSTAAHPSVAIAAPLSPLSQRRGRAKVRGGTGTQHGSLDGPSDGSPGGGYGSRVAHPATLACWCSGTDMGTEGEEEASWSILPWKQNEEADPNGTIWGDPYRWGTMVFVYMKKDWEDLWRPKLAGRISMVDSPKEVIGAVLKHMGSSYNTVDMEMDVNGGRGAVLNSFTQLPNPLELEICHPRRITAILLH